MNPNQHPNDPKQADDDHQRTAARQELHNTLRDRYETGLNNIDDPDLADQPATTAATRQTDWQPATSRPGETLTIEGQIRSIGTFAHNLRNNDPQLQPYRQTMARTGLVFAALAAAVLTIAIAIDAAL